MTRIDTIDAHTAGEPLRLIVAGFPTVEGATILEQREFVRQNYDHLRRALMLEPRGHADMYGALLTTPEHLGSHAGVLFMHNQGYSTMCGHGVIAVTTIAIERNLILLPRKTDGTVRLTLDSPAGPIHATAVLDDVGRGSSDDVGRGFSDDVGRGFSDDVGRGFTPADDVGRGFSDDVGRGFSDDVGRGFSDDVGRGFTPAAPRVKSVRFRNVPSFVLHAAVPVLVGTREVRADVAFGGAFYAIVDSEAVGIPIVPERLPELRKAGMEIKHAIEKALVVQHPLEPQLHGIYGTIFTGPPSDESADLRNVTIFADAEVDRSPCGTGTAAVMAVLAAMGMLTEGEQVFTHESIIGTRFRGRLAGRTTLSTSKLQLPTTNEIDAIIPEIEGEAYITGENTFLIDDRDPLKHGFRL